jgi:pimeloyl-ACP methyl ester carboxylesterase
VLAIPLVMEIARLPMNEDERENAPGQFATLPKGITHFEWTGPENGPVVVCIHGLTTPSFVWQSTARGLAEAGYRVLTYDLYGRGYSDRPMGRQDPAFFLQQLNNLLKDQKVTGDLAVIGYSMGGAIASLFAAARPDDIRQVVLLAPAGMTPVGDGILGFMVRTPVIGTWLMMMLYPHLLKRGIAKEKDLPTTVKDISYLQKTELDYRGFVPSVLASLRGMLNTVLQDTHEKLHAEGIPVLAIWGAQDDVIPLSAKDQLLAWNADSLQYVIEDAGHGLTYTHTDEMLEQVKLFLKVSS